MKGISIMAENPALNTNNCCINDHEIVILAKSLESLLPEWCITIIDGYLKIQLPLRARAAGHYRDDNTLLWACRQLAGDNVSFSVLRNRPLLKGGNSIAKAFVDVDVDVDETLLKADYAVSVLTNY